MLARLYAVVKETFDVEINNIYLWSNSAIVLCWIRLEPNTLKTFVANCISEIQKLTAGAAWLHVSSSDNPADMFSKGVNAKELIERQLWWHGPRWIVDQDQWPHQEECSEMPMPELKNLTAITVQANQELIGRYLRIIN